MCVNFKRVVTALVLFPLLVVVLIKGPYQLLITLVGFSGLICLYEWTRLYDLKFPWFLGLSILWFFGLLGFFWLKDPLMVFFMFLVFPFLPFLRQYEKDRFAKEFFPAVLGLFYVGIGLYPFLEIISFFSREHLVYFFAVVFANDTGAYLTGKLLGKRLLVPKISPKKTWEGFIGGILLGVVVSVFCNYLFKIFSFEINLLTSLILCLFGVLGDLLESAFKRMVGKKDSGKIIWGHGGLLDRIDGVMVASPVYLFWLKFIT